jgi:5'-nucleotidase (lipoprotein e(P4) family)
LIKKILLIVWLITPFLSSAEDIELPEQKANLASNSPSYDSLLWYRSSAEAKVIYLQVFNNGYDQIMDNVAESGLKTNAWAVVFALDGTLLDNSKTKTTQMSLRSNASEDVHQAIESTNYYTALPGASEISCDLKDAGARVIIITNRDGSINNKNLNMISWTQENLKQQHICYDSVIFATHASDTNKNPRFSAVINGDYENVITTKTLPPLPIMGYFGSDIQDFPNFKQNMAHDYSTDDEQFDDFGYKYFMLPNPTQGSWLNNRLK